MGLLTSIAVTQMRPRMNGRRRSMSPNGQMKSKPAAYPACISVATDDALSKLTLNVSAILLRTGWL